MKSEKQSSKQIIIQSIGTANPSCARILEDSLKLPQELVLKQLYNAPSVLFPNVEFELATELKKQLTKLGLEIELKDTTEQIHFSKENYEVSINVQEIKNLPYVLKSMSDFLGTSIQECVQLLGDERRVVIGGVSKATALAMKKRIPAAICYTNPKLDAYTIRFDDAIPDQVVQTLLTSGIQKSQINLTRRQICNLDYQQSQKIWNNYHSQNGIQIINQSHQIISLELVDFDLNNQNHINFLNKSIGIPQEVLPQIHANTPVVLFENITRHNSMELIQTLDDLSMDYRIKEVDVSPKFIEASDIEDQIEFQNVMNQFFNLNAKTNVKHWRSERKVPFVIAMYIQDQLQSINCKVKMN
ncbi:MAG: hypothetical protein AAGA77_17525 [Bacteroidota bacterium]